MTTVYLKNSPVTEGAEPCPGSAADTGRKEIKSITEITYQICGGRWHAVSGLLTDGLVTGAWQRMRLNQIRFERRRRLEEKK